MNQLTKLIEQYERENPGKKAFTRNFNKYGNEQPPTYTNDFVLWLVSRPTCGKEQRLFLDEIQEKGKYNPSYDAIKIAGTEIWKNDFNANLEKVINGE